MKSLHHWEKEQFKKLFQQEELDRFEDRYKVLEVFLLTEGHITAKELDDLLAEKGYDPDPEFVRDTLKLLCRFGFAQKYKFNNGNIRYEHRHLGQHHDHMICTKCQKIIEFQNEQLESLQDRIAATHGFHMLQHKMEIYGICADCIKNRTQLLTLTMAKPGERLVIKDIAGGPGPRARILSMGLNIGSKIDVITNYNKGQMVIASGDHRLILGRGMAQKIRVEQVSR